MANTFKELAEKQAKNIKNKPKQAGLSKSEIAKFATILKNAFTIKNLKIISEVVALGGDINTIVDGRRLLSFSRGADWDFYKSVLDMGYKPDLGNRYASDLIHSVREDNVKMFLSILQYSNISYQELKKLPINNGKISPDYLMSLGAVKIFSALCDLDEFKQECLAVDFPSKNNPLMNFVISLNKQSPFDFGIKSHIWEQYFVMYKKMGFDWTTENANKDNILTIYLKNAKIVDNYITMELINGKYAGDFVTNEKLKKIVPELISQRLSKQPNSINYSMLLSKIETVIINSENKKQKTNKKQIKI